MSIAQRYGCGRPSASAELRLQGRFFYGSHDIGAAEVTSKCGKLEIDNNIVENAIRPSALGKKNWLFIGCADAGERSGILYTIIESCRKRGIDPFAYLRDMFTRLPSMTNWQIEDITPEAWAKERKAAALKAAA